MFFPGYLIIHKEEHHVGKKRRNHSPSFKAKVALEAIRGESTMSELAEKYDLHANQIQRWKADLIAGAADVFGGNKQERQDNEKQIDKLHSKIGQLTMERDFLSKALSR